jgi:cyclic beta-1,2-glucan synthetase
VSPQAAPLFEHAVRAIAHAMKYGAHGLPLMGSGDWNDGMNLVGIEGRGESIWLAFFLCSVLAQFGSVARQRGDTAFAQRCADETKKLRKNIEKHGWDGAWYRRAYFDDGTPLGSAGAAECEIDSISQSWSVLSGMGDPKHSRVAMNSVYERLVRHDARLVQLLTPPFDRSLHHPGYISGYVPGVRENGGQYTHAAIWAVMAFAALGDAPRAWELMNLINPVNHGRTAEDVAVYRVEPYVVAADVYANAPHTGRGGWSWYTGSAGWMYRLILESLLGVQLAGDKLLLSPCLPVQWKGYTLRYRYRDTTYHVSVSQAERGDGRARAWLDGTFQPGNAIPLMDDGVDHRIEVEIGPRMQAVAAPEAPAGGDRRALS